MSTRRHAAGMSLLEMLVVMVISAIAITLTTQAIGQYQRAQASAIYNERAGREFVLSEAWFRDAVRGLYPIEEAVFEGSSEGFSGISLAPVLGPRGTPVPQQWRAIIFADGSAGLRLDEDGEQITLVVRRARALRFTYLDDEGSWHDQWPPALGTGPHLPEAIALEVEDDTSTRTPRTVLASVAGIRDVPFRPFELEADW